MSISGNGGAAWVATDASFQLKAGGQEMILPARITFVLEKRGPEWLIMQAHFSIPAAHQEEAKSIPKS